MNTAIKPYDYLDSAGPLFPATIIVFGNGDVCAQRDDWRGPRRKSADYRDGYSGARRAAEQDALDRNLAAKRAANRLPRVRKSANRLVQKIRNARELRRAATVVPSWTTTLDFAHENKWVKQLRSLFASRHQVTR